MKRLSLVIFSVAVLLFLFLRIPDKSQPDTVQMVNPIIGDLSFMEKFGYQPNKFTDNELRIKTHLQYVEQLLRRKNISKLPDYLQTKRSHVLDLLGDYAEAGIFPKNYDYQNQRKPCFIDRNNTICAVGYLIEQTTNRKTAENINRQHQYDELLAMNDKIVDDWIAGSGLSKEECAMIQPTYGPSGTYTFNRIPPGYGLTSSLLGGINLSLNTINGIQIANGTDRKAVPVIGLITGAGQVVLGAIKFPSKVDGYSGTIGYTNESQKTLAMVNIALGTTTLVLSTWNLIANKNPESKRTTWNLHSFPDQKNRTGLAISMTRKF